MPLSERLRLDIWERDEGTCQLCGGPGSEIHHVVHKGMGGRKGADDDLNLLQLVCACGAARSSTILMVCMILQCGRWDTLMAPATQSP